MIENVTWLDLAGVAAVVALVYGGLRAYAAWWVRSGRAARTAARMKLQDAKPAEAQPAVAGRARLGHTAV